MKKCVICNIEFSDSFKHKCREMCSKCYYNWYNEEQIKSKSERRDKGYYKELITCEFFQEKYFQNKMSLGDISKEIGCSEQYLCKRAKELNIDLRDLEESSGRRIHNIEKDFFKNHTSEMFWVLGFIFSDGCLSKTGNSISISQKEIEPLRKIEKLLFEDENNHIHSRANINGFSNGNEINILSLNSKTLYNDLLTFGLCKKKSNIIEFPNIPFQFQRDFIRGLWDGDGSFYISSRKNKNKKDYLTASFTSGSEQFIIKLLECLEENGFRKRNYYKDKAFYFRIHGKEAIKFGHFLYDKTPENILLKRKYMTWKYCLGKQNEDLLG